MEVSAPQGITATQEALPTVTDEKKLADALRILCIDQVQAANSGHPGGPLGLADVACVLWRRHLSINPLNPGWINRDRVVFSNGHCSALQYALLYLCGYPLSLDDLKAFRQLSSLTPGHPEFGLTPGVEATTGPLAQGLCNGVGMALARRRTAELFNTPDCTLIDHLVYVLVGDGCLMEGVSQEAMSLAGQWRLGELIVLYDQNNVSIDGDTAGWFSEDTAARARACHWHVIDAIDGHNRDEVDAAIAEARAQTQKPSLLLCRTCIGYGSPNKAGSADCHGAPLGQEETAATRRKLGWEIDEAFEVPAEILSAWDQRGVGARRQAQWQKKWQDYREQHAGRARALAERFGLNISDASPRSDEQRGLQWTERLQRAQQKLIGSIDSGAKAATRQISGKCLEELMEDFDELIGGSADLSQSNCVINSRTRTITGEDHRGNFLHYGAREFAMVAINNGLSLYGGHIPFSASFLVFSDYARNGIRMCALMKLRHILIMTHDSISLGEDGPTHQPVEHLESLRLIPGLELWRPACARETVVAWCQSLLRQGPGLLALTRQKLPASGNPEVSVENIARGGYILRDCDNFNVIIIAAGSELALASMLAQDLGGHRVRVVSMPNRQRFLAQDKDYRDSVLAPDCAYRIAIEAGCCGLWRAVIGDRGLFIGIEHFGHSAPAGDVVRACGLDPDSVRERAQAYLNNPPDSL